MNLQNLQPSKTVVHLNAQFEAQIYTDCLLLSLSQEIVFILAAAASNLMKVQNLILKKWVR